ncbi:unnamed protein product [marine sediment metagenome]|uniref:Uncharacterized protein n=1 Tax=marine sediment metagenome TaxID=412755 RepID=X0YCD6_9ZZZZ
MGVMDNDQREHAKMAAEIWREFGFILEKQLPDLNDIMVLAATKVAREHFNPKNHNMSFSTSLNVSSAEDATTITIRIKK